MAGLFVLACIILAVICVIALSNVRELLTRKALYIVRFSLMDGAEGLDKGAPVKLAGKRVGRVDSVKFQPEDGEPRFVEASIEIDAKIRLASDVDAQLIRPLLGSGSSINLAPPTPAPIANPPASSSTPPRAPTELAPNSVIIGHLGAPGFIAPTDYARLQAIIANVDSIVADVKPRIKPIIDQTEAAVSDFRSVASDAKSVTAEVRQKWPTWEEQISDVVRRVQEESKKVEGLGQQVNDAVSQARDLITRGQQIVDENRPAIKEAVDKVRDLVAKADGEAYDRVMAVVANAKAATEAAQSTAQHVNELVTEKSDALRDIITDATIAAQQIKLATTEIRASPWRLLYQPTKKELENELLYNSVRQYAESVTELKSAADALKAVTQGTGAAGSGSVRADSATVELLTAKLKAAFDKYQEREKAFLDRWVNSGK